MVTSLRALGPLALTVTVFAASSLGCNKSQDTSTTNATPPASSAATPSAPATSAAPTNAPAKTYDARGTVKAFGEGRKTVKISHEEIPGYMKAMTMPFAVSSTNALDGLKEGDAVDFTFAEQGDGRLLIQSIKKR